MHDLPDRPLPALRRWNTDTILPIFLVLHTPGGRTALDESGPFGDRTMLLAALVVNLTQSLAIAPELLLDHIAIRIVAVNDSRASSRVAMHFAIAGIFFSLGNARSPIAMLAGWSCVRCRRP
jgi:hypothetical protein